MTALPYLSAARFHGPEASAFLQSQLSADVGGLEAGEATFACYCSPRGQVFGLLLVFRRNEDFLVAGAADLMDGMLQRLKMYVFRTRVEFSVQPDITVCGLASDDAGGGPGLARPAETDLAYRFSETPVEEAATPDDFRAMEICRGIAWLGAETTEKFIPQMLGFNRLGAVSFTKGCYPGQEIVARARYLGKVKRGPVIVRTAETLAAGPADRIELRRDGAWSHGTVVDTAPVDGNGGTWCFVIAASEPESVPDELKFGERTYRCATT